MKIYKVKSPHKMKIGEAMKTAEQLIKVLGLNPDLLPLVPQTFSNRPRRTGAGDKWQSIGKYTKTDYILVIHLYGDSPEIDLQLPHLEIVDRPNQQMFCPSL